jgi:hypothetical protein
VVNSAINHIFIRSQNIFIQFLANDFDLADCIYLFLVNYVNFVIESSYYFGMYFFPLFQVIEANQDYFYRGIGMGNIKYDCDTFYNFFLHLIDCSQLEVELMVNFYAPLWHQRTPNYSAFYDND